MTLTCKPHSLLAVATLAGLTAGGHAAPVLGSWPVADGDDTAAVAAAPFSGWYAAADSFQNSVEIRDVRGNLIRTITAAQIATLVPWMSLDGGPDGPSAVAFTASGRQLFILVHDDTIPGDGQPSDAILRYDRPSDTLVRQTRLELYDRGDLFPHLSAVHFKGYLYGGTNSGTVSIYRNTTFQADTSPFATWSLPGAGANVPVRGLAIDRDAGLMYLATDAVIYRATIPASPTSTPTFTTLSTPAGGDIRALAWADHYGAAANRGLYILRGNSAPPGSRIDFIAASAATSGSGVTPAAYTTTADVWHDLTFTADGALLAGADEDAVRITESTETRLGFDAWMADEFNQNVTFGRGLISPDGEPAGWVIDGDVPPGNSRFHPATPDGACWTVLLLLASDALNADPNAQAQVRTVLTRYAGLAPDGIKPFRNADGIFKHWIDPLTGNTKAGWFDEYATLSTMKIVAAAARAMDYYPDDPAIVNAASRIIFRTKNWDAYVRISDHAMAFIGNAGGGPTNSWARGYHEGIIFLDQAGTYGGATAQTEKAFWFTRSNWPTGSYLPGRPVSTANFGQFDAAFLSLYPALLCPLYRADSAPGGWRENVSNLRWGNGAWTDDNANRYFTVFSAGTSPSGYNADSLATNNHPGNISTFTSLMAMCAFGDTSEAVGAYAAYRKGARQTWKTGASLLYRRPTDNTVFTPNSAGLPDVALGALGLTEILSPGLIDQVLSRPYPTVEMCPTDLNGDGLIDIEDLHVLTASPIDINGDGLANAADRACLINWLRRHEGTDATGR